MQSAPVAIPDAMGACKEAARSRFPLMVATVADWLLPELVDRPLSLLHCPNEIGRTCFFQKHYGDGLWPGVYPVRLQKRDGEDDVCVCAQPPGRPVAGAGEHHRVPPLGRPADRA